VSTWIGRHLLEPRARPPLSLAAAIGGRPRPVEALDQVVADLLELGHVGDVALRAKEGMGGLAGLAGIARVGGELSLEMRDLAAELLAADAFVGRDLRHTGFRSVDFPRSLAGRIDRPRQVAWIDPLLTGLLDGVGGEAPEVRRARGVLGHERPEPVARRDQAVLFQAAVHSPGCVDVHSRSARELTDAGQTIARAELPAGDQDPEPPGELGADRQVVGTGQIRRQAGRSGRWLG
jgi:hypothetical protein